MVVDVLSWKNCNSDGYMTKCIGSSICIFFCFQQCEYQLALGNTILANLVKMYSKSGSLCTYTAILIYLAGGLCNCAERMWSNKHKPPALQLQGCRSRENFRFYLQWINQFLTFTVLFENKTRNLLLIYAIFDLMPWWKVAQPRTKVRHWLYTYNCALCNVCIIC